MFGFGKTKAHREIDAQTLNAMLADGSAVLVDVREPDEFAAEHIKGAVSAPLSTFAPRNVPDAGGRTIVLQCAGGKRSGLALDRCASAQSSINTHLAGESPPGRRQACPSNAARTMKQGSHRW